MLTPSEVAVIEKKNRSRGLGPSPDIEDVCDLIETVRQLEFRLTLTDEERQVWYEDSEEKNKQIRELSKRVTTSYGALDRAFEDNRIKGIVKHLQGLGLNLVVEI